MFNYVCNSQPGSILQLGRNTLLAKLKMLTVIYQYTLQTAVSWNQALHIEMVFPFSLRSAPKTFLAVIALHKGVSIL